MMKTPQPLALQAGAAHAPPSLSAGNFSRTPLGRTVLHLECLCQHPAAARFYLGGMVRNLREWARSA